VLCRVITLSNGLRALLISDQQPVADSSKSVDDHNLSQNGEHAVDTEDGAEVSCMQDQFSVAYEDDVGSDAVDTVGSDDGNSSWTDISSGSSVHDLTFDSPAKKVGGKKRSQHKQSASNVHICTGEKLVNIVLIFILGIYG